MVWISIDDLRGGIKVTRRMRGAKGVAEPTMGEYLGVRLHTIAVVPVYSAILGGGGNRGSPGSGPPGHIESMLVLRRSLMVCREVSPSPGSVVCVCVCVCVFRVISFLPVFF